MNDASLPESGCRQCQELTKTQCFAELKTKAATSLAVRGISAPAGSPSLLTDCLAGRLASDIDRCIFPVCPDDGLIVVQRTPGQYLYAWELACPWTLSGKARQVLHIAGG